MRTIYERREVLQNIQGVRALASLAVVAYHLGVMPFGQCGVDLFFVVSGFIMSYVAPDEGRRFLLKRLIRILPLYWLSTIGIYAIATIKPQWLNTTTASLNYLVRSLLFIPYVKENGHWGPLNLNGWTLEYEMFFYLIIAATLCVVRSSWATLVAAITLSIYCIVVALVEPAHPVIRYLGQPFLLEFCLGVVTYFLVKTRMTSRVTRKFWMIFAGLGLFAMPAWFYVCGAPDGFVRTFAYGVPSFIFVTSVIAVEQAGWATCSRLAARLGAASYAIYLLHPYVVGIFKKILGREVILYSLSGFAETLAVLIVVCIAGDICHRFVERPLLSVLNRIYRPGASRKAELA